MQIFDCKKCKYLDYLEYFFRMFFYKILLFNYNLSTKTSANEVFLLKKQKVRIMTNVIKNKPLKNFCKIN